MRRIEYISGEVVGQNGLIYLSEEAPVGERRRRAASFKCGCGNVFVSQIESVKEGKTSSCGCYKKTAKGLSSHTLYQTWASMKHRCLDSRTKGYDRYGGRGISVCHEWKEDFNAFYDWAISSGWNEGLQIDRIDNDGDSSPDNCRFVTRSENCRNRKVRGDNKTGHAGVSLKKNGRYKAVINASPNNRVVIGTFGTMQEAIEARKNAEIKYWN